MSSSSPRNTTSMGPWGARVSYEPDPREPEPEPQPTENSAAADLAIVIIGILGLGVFLVHSISTGQVQF